MIETMLDFVLIRCYKCSMQFQMPRGFYNLRKEDGHEFYCPAGHQQYFADSDVTVLRKQLQQALSSKAFYAERSETYRANLIKEEHRTRGLKSALTLTKKRIAKGKCPCCTRIFTDLENHLKEKHKDYLKH